MTALIGAPVDFSALFPGNEAGDEEADGVAVICEAIDQAFGGEVFTVKDVSVLLDPGPEPQGFANLSEKAAWQASHDQAAALREALQSLHEVPLPHGPLPNPRLGQILGKAENRPVRVGGKTVRLRLVHKGHNAKTYRLEVL